MHLQEVLNRLQELELRVTLLERELEQLRPPPLPSERGWTHLEPWQIYLRCKS